MLQTRFDHRPWALPKNPYQMIQVWHDLLFIHWPIDPNLLQQKLPEGFCLDTFEGRGWIGIVPFRMTGIRLRGTPAIPGFSAFPELNVRTYVTFGGRGGVYFFSLDASHPVMAEIARVWYHLNYFRSQIIFQKRDEEVFFKSVRKDRRSLPAEFQGRYTPQKDVFYATSGTLDHWLTERYCLYVSTSKNQIFRGDIHHAPWPLQKATLTLEQNTMTHFFGLALPDENPRILFSQRMEAFIWPLKRL